MKEGAFVSALRLIEDALDLVKRADALAWTIYLAGAVPFFALLLFEVTDLFQNPFVAEHFIFAALLLALLYFWLHISQSVFCARLYGTLVEQQGRFREQLIPSVKCQCVLAGSKLLIWPITLCLVIPHAAITMFYQHSLFVAQEHAQQQAGSNWRITVKEARYDAAYRQVQAICLLLLVFALRVLVWLNLFVLLFVIPSLWKTLTGMENNLTRNPQLLLNPTSIMALCVLSYLALDPLVKAACVLRRFARQSQSSGRDLRLKLSLIGRVATAALLVITLIATPRPARAEVSDRQMKQAIHHVFHDPANSWNLPVVRPAKKPTGAFASFAQSIADQMDKAWDNLGKAIDRFVEWLNNLFSTHHRTTEQKQKPVTKADTTVLIACFSALLAAAVIFSLWQRRRRLPARRIEAAAVAIKPIDISSEDIAASDQTEQEWIALARGFQKAGDFRLALRAFYLSSLATLARSGLISLARGKTNLEYSRELERRAKRHGPQLVTIFRSNLQLVEKSWYGNYPATETAVESFLQNLSALEEAL